ncbi:cupredoxin family copper-binding protein [Chitinophagaceae bacterium LB-8]|uniref:Cupredoxin family copper-binding protein n=1 Tax=Paraflavisolibacter caeni TaxID=2982496 RepID=A0A9X3BFM3_9BACT|nr:cupredoxin family copper-binding protein [Paraflavisolibacter caeni]MCU7549204.1 cupredoxin family copper-binding protein [Paraflavisolibacter caeni]
MHYTLEILRNSIYFLCFVFLLSSCSPVQEKTIPKVHTVEIKQMKFQPAELTVQKGDTVVWINKDIVAHDVTEESNKAWTSSILPLGKSWSMVATQSSNYYCSIHVVMKGKLVVQ